MAEAVSPSFTAFRGHQRLVSGPLAEVALAVMQASNSGDAEPIVIFDDANGRTIDLNLRGTEQDVIGHLPQPPANLEAAADHLSAPEPRGRGRPKLGVVAREVTLLPRHWEWLGTQPGGASVALRKLVEEARRASGDRDRSRAARDAAYHFMSTMAGNLRPAAVRRSHRRLARRYPRPHRQARLQRSRRIRFGVTAAHRRC
jgi:hypothetical protein